MIKVGLVRMVARDGYRRDFLPDFVRSIHESPTMDIIMEEGYGSDFGLSAHDYLGTKCMKKRDEVIRESDLVLSLTVPPIDDIKKMGQGQTLMTMLHFPVREDRNKIMAELGINAISLDALVDWEGMRLVQDIRRTSWNAVTAGFTELKKVLGDSYWFDKDRPELNIYMIGCGAVGRHALNAALKMGNTNYQNELLEKKANPFTKVLATSSLHSEQDYLINLLKEGYEPSMVIDTSLRKHMNKEILKKEMVGRLPEKCIILDVTADGYFGKIVKGIEGIPTGDEYKYAFHPNDPEWTDPRVVPELHQIKDPSKRRVTVSHHAWPALGDVEDRIDNMFKYGRQILPFIRVLKDMDLENFDCYNNGSVWCFEKSLYQASLRYYLQQQA